MHRSFRIPVLAALALILTWTSAEASVTLKKPIQHTYPLKSGGRLEVQNTNGSVTVEAWDRNEVQVEAMRQVKAESNAKAEELMKKIRIDVKASANEVRIETRLPNEGSGFFDWLTGNSASFSVTYKIHAPREVAAKLVSTNGALRLAGTHGQADLETTNGGVTVEHVAGTIRMESTNGGLKVIESSGSVQGETTNGGITAQLTEVDGDVSLETVNGSVTVRVPQDVRASLDVETANGGIHTDLDVQGGHKSRNSLTGEVNGGGGQLKIRTVNGGVHIGAQ